MLDWEKIKEELTGLDEQAMEAARERQLQLLKPAGSLGLLEDMSIRMAGITGKVKNRLHKKILFLFGADNGVYAEGIAASPQELTHTLMDFYARGIQCGINVICHANGVELRLVDMGIKGEFHSPNIDDHKLMWGTDNFAKGLAMPRDTVLKAMEVGFSYARYAKENGYDILGNGEVGMGNTTTAAACIMACLGLQDPEQAVGRGAGLTDEAYAHKKEVIAKALEMHKPDASDPVDILSKVGGLDLAAMTGLYIGAAYYRLPIVVDGVISIAGALLASRFSPITSQFLFGSHVSKEPGYVLAAQALNLKPMLMLGMRLGEGSGCPVAMTVMDTAMSVMCDMNTFGEEKVDQEYRKDIKAD